MRWFKHLSMAHEDDQLSAVTDEYGAEAYGVYWYIVEHIAAAMEKDSPHPRLTKSDVKWASDCRCSVRKFRSIVQRLAEEKLIDITSTKNRLQIEVRTLLKYRDEYAKKSGQTPDTTTSDQIRSD